METADRRDGFALFGGFRARHRFAGMYLQGSNPVRLRFALHQPTTVGDCRTLASRYGLVVFCGQSAPPALHPELFRMPLGIDMELTLPEPLDGPEWSRSARANIAKVRRAGFRFDVVESEPKSIAAFHRSMFSPSMRARHGPAASIQSERALIGLAQGSELFRVWQGERWVAGAVAKSTPSGYRLLKLGWLTGDENLLKNGVVASIYWFAFQRAAALGHQRVLLGSVEPCLENGVLRHKAYWGAGLSRDSRDFGEFQLLLEPSHAVCRRFLARNSLIAKAADGGFIVFSTRTPNHDIARAVLKTIARWYVWRDTPAAEPEVSAPEVPHQLRRWLAQAALPPSR